MPQCRNYGAISRSVEPQNYSELREEVKKFVKHWIEGVTQINSSKVDIKVLPNVGYYRNGWAFKIETLTPFDLAGSFMLHYLLKEMGEENFFDLTHGINYAPTLLRELSLLSILLKSMGTYKDVKGIFLNAEPYIANKTLKIHEVDVIEAKPKAASKEAFLWMIRYEKILRGKLNPIKFSGSSIPQSLIKINSTFRDLDKDLKPLAGAFRISAPLAMAKLSKERDLAMAKLSKERDYEKEIDKIFEELSKFVKVSEKCVTWRYVPSLSNLIVLNVLLSLDQFIRKAVSASKKHGGCKVVGYGVCLEDLVRKVGGMQEDVAAHELNNLLRKDFEEIEGKGDCESVDLRNFIAHAGLEKNTVEVKKLNGQYELRYVCGEDRLMELLKNVLVNFLS